MPFGKGPPRFVPTLTEVVRPVELKAAGPVAPPEAVVTSAPAAPAKLPPGFAELLQDWPAGLGLAPEQPKPPEPGAQSSIAPPAPAQVSAELQQVMVERILQIVEDSLEQRLHQALELVLAPHLQSLAAVVRTELAESVAQAVSDTLAAGLQQPGNSHEA